MADRRLTVNVDEASGDAGEDVAAMAISPAAAVPPTPDTADGPNPPEEHHMVPFYSPPQVDLHSSDVVFNALSAEERAVAVQRLQTVERAKLLRLFNADVARDARLEHQRSLRRPPYEQPPAKELWLPVEVWLYVFQNLTPQHLGKCAQVCRAWRSVADDDAIWRRLTVGQLRLRLWYFKPRIFVEKDDDETWKQLYKRLLRNKRPSDVSVNLPHVETALRFAIPAGREEFTSPKQIPISENRIIGAIRFVGWCPAPTARVLLPLVNNILQTWTSEAVISEVLNTYQRLLSSRKGVPAPLDLMNVRDIISLLHHRHTPAVSMEACRFLSKLCRYDKTGGAVGLRPTERDYIIMAGVSAFRSPPHDNQPFMYWLTGMVAWALADVNGRSYAFIAAGGVPLFVGALHATNESWLVCQCLRVLAWVFKNLKEGDLASLAEDAPDLVSVVVAHVLDPQDNSVRELAAWCLGELASVSHTYAAEILSVCPAEVFLSGIRATTVAASSPGGVTDEVSAYAERCIKTLTALYGWLEFRPPAEDFRACLSVLEPYLKRLVHEKRRQRTIWSIYKMIPSDRDKHILAETGLVEYIVRCVENERSEVSVVRAALACLSRLTYLRDEDPPVDAILALGGMEVVASLVTEENIVALLGRQGILGWVCAFVGNMIFNRPACVERWIELPAAAFLIDILDGERFLQHVGMAKARQEVLLVMVNMGEKSLTGANWLVSKGVLRLVPRLLNDELVAQKACILLAKMVGHNAPLITSVLETEGVFTALHGSMFNSNTVGPISQLCRSVADVGTPEQVFRVICGTGYLNKIFQKVSASDVLTYLDRVSNLELRWLKTIALTLERVPDWRALTSVFAGLAEENVLPLHSEVMGKQVDLMTALEQLRDRARRIIEIQPLVDEIGTIYRRREDEAIAAEQSLLFIQRTNSGVSDASPRSPGGMKASSVAAVAAMAPLAPGVGEGDVAPDDDTDGAEEGVANPDDDVTGDHW